jgi:hypothetical protein
MMMMIMPLFPPDPINTHDLHFTRSILLKRLVAITSQNHKKGTYFYIKYTTPATEYGGISHEVCDVCPARVRAATCFLVLQWLRNPTKAQQMPTESNKL